MGERLDWVKSTGFVAGEPVGVLAFKKAEPRLPGDPVRADAWRGIPIFYHLIDSLPLSSLQNYDPATCRSLREACLAVQDAGAAAVVGTCGLLAIYQKPVAAALNIPAYLSPLLLVHLAHLATGRRGPIGVLTPHSEVLSKAHLAGVEVEPSSVIIQGLQECRSLSSWILENESCIEIRPIASEIVQAAAKLKEKGVVAIVVECTNLSFFTEHIWQALHIPVFGAHHLMWTAFLNRSVPVMT